jgi:hypothetical protein
MMTFDQENHMPMEVSDKQMAVLSSMSDVDHMDKILDNLVVPRTVGTEGHKKV